MLMYLGVGDVSVEKSMLCSVIFNSVSIRMKEANTKKGDSANSRDTLLRMKGLKACESISRSTA